MKYYKNKAVIFSFLMPALIMMTLFLFYPFVMSFVKSFYETDGFMQSTFIGLDNYRRLLDDPTIRTAVFNTFELMGYVIVFEIGIACILAIMVDSLTKGQNFFRTVYFFPIVISATAIGMMFKLFYTYNGGLFNAILLELGREPRVWITVQNALRVVAIPTVWQYIGFYFVILLAAIKQIPTELYESARLDGITGVTRTFYITLPLIRNVILTTLILAITGTLKVFDMVMVITEGGPLNSSQLLGLYMYQKAFTDEVFGYGATIAVAIVILGLVISIIVNNVFRKEDITY